MTVHPSVFSWCHSAPFKQPSILDSMVANSLLFAEELTRGRNVFVFGSVSSSDQKTRVWPRDPLPGVSVLIPEKSKPSKT